MEIGLYEGWMKPQVAQLFNKQYGVSEDDFAKLIDDFYELPFQKNKCIRIIAREGDLIIGFQSFFYWPYTFNNQTYNSYQSGNSLVHENYRGKGIFQKLLNYIDEHSKKLEIDFLVGFPVEQSKNSFIRNNWKNILNLRWYLKIINPAAFLFNFKELHQSFDALPLVKAEDSVSNFLRLHKTEEFNTWRNNYSSAVYFYYNYTKGDQTITFQLKSNKRNKWFNELIIGDIACSSFDYQLIKEAFIGLKIKIRKKLSVTSLTIALNEHTENPLKSILKNLGYIRTKKEIYFIIKSFSDNITIEDPSKWILYRSDIDTW